MALSMMMSVISDEQDSFVVLDESPEETIGQLTLDDLTIDQAVYTIGTLTQRIEQLTAAMAAANLSHSTYEPGAAQSVKLKPHHKVSCSVQTEHCNGIDESVSVVPQTSSYLQQTSLVDEEVTTKTRDTISDLQTTMERLSAEKVSYLTCLAERDRRLIATKEELRKAKADRAAMEEVLQSHSHALERTEIALSETKAELQTKDELVKELKAALDASREEAISLRYIAQMSDKDGTGDGVMVDADLPPIPSISYPYHSVPPDRRQW